MIFTGPERVGAEVGVMVGVTDGPEGSGSSGIGSGSCPLGADEGLDGTRLGGPEGVKDGGDWVTTAVTTELLTDFTVTGLAPTLAAWAVSVDVKAADENELEWF